MYAVPWLYSRFNFNVEKVLKYLFCPEIPVIYIYST